MSMPRIRILQLIKYLDISGPERFGTSLVRALDPDLFDIKLVSFFKTGTPVEQYWSNILKNSGVDVYFASHWEGNDRFKTYLQGIRSIGPLLKAWPVDIIHSHFQLGTITGLFFRTIGQSRKVIRTTHVHCRKEWDPNFYGWVRFQIFSRWGYPILLDAEIGVSAAIVDELKSHPGARFARRPAQVIYNAIPSDLVAQAQRFPQTKGDGNHPVIGSIGRLSEQKGYQFLLEAMPLLLTHFPNLELWLIGDGELRETLVERTRQLGIEDQIRLLGRQSEILPLLRKMDLFVLPSLWEGLPTVVLESMAAGVPVVSTDIPGTRELIQNGITGWLVPAGDPPALAAAITTALQNPNQCQTVIQNAFRRLNIFQIDSVADQYTKLYQDLMKDGKPG